MPNDRYKNKYRIASARAPWWNYGWNGAYFITICTKNRAHYFGEIENGKMHLSEIGRMVQTGWEAIPAHFPYMHLDAFVIMPNHTHGILVIDKPVDGSDNRNGGIATNDADNAAAAVETPLMASLPKPASLQTPGSRPPSDKTIGGITGNNNPMLHENLPRMLRWLKGRISYEAHKIDPGFEWQERYHDHIIRNEESWQNISRYIATNPQNWKDDRFYTD